jgi:hypothetical protein
VSQQKELVQPAILQHILLGSDTVYAKRIKGNSEGFTLFIEHKIAPDF